MNKLKHKILIVEDEEAIGFLLRQNLEYEGYEVDWAKDGEAGIKLSEQFEPDLILLDLMLPKVSGMEICKRLRAGGNEVPIIMLTAKGERIDKILGLKSGADDYITKPFDILELSARIEALLRRSGKRQVQEGSLMLGEKEIDFNKHCIREGETEHPMSQTEVQLLRYLMHHAGTVLSREQLMKDVWGHEVFINSRTIDTHITKLRQKVEPDPRHPKHIVTVHRVGYKFVL